MRPTASPQAPRCHGVHIARQAAASARTNVPSQTDLRTSPHSTAGVCCGRRRRSPCPGAGHPPWSACGSVTTQGGLVTSAPTSRVHPEDTYAPASRAPLAKRTWSRGKEGARGTGWSHSAARGPGPGVSPTCPAGSPRFRTVGHNILSMSSDCRPAESRRFRWLAKPRGARGLVSFSQSHPRANDSEVCESLHRLSPAPWGLGDPGKPRCQFSGL